ncbi:MAG: radical SAM family heme chaperone HemW [Candidatus Nanopelagicales bacterium]|nr:radical SAM family heme chaperone HemW [Candidatus Nanopelagicales bacterium]
MRVRAPLGVYVHVPYCARRCDYCDFNTYVLGEEQGETRDGWVEAALAEISASAQLTGRTGQVRTVFFGGGTPTLLSGTEIGAVVSRIDRELGLDVNAEITVEANPETVNPEMLDELLAQGVNRLSVGVQSTDSGVLETLGRRHSPDRALSAVRLAEAAGFDRVSVDLIYGTPGETLPSWRETVSAVIGTGVGHVSAYALKVEDGTRLFRRIADNEVPSPDEDQAAAAYEEADSLLSEAGLGWYEISNWCRSGQECEHNLGYWRGRDWLGIGPGAHSHVRGERWWNERNPGKWMRCVADGQLPRVGGELLSAEQRLTEHVMLCIRLREGLELSCLPTGVRAVACDLADRGLLDPAELGLGRCVLTLAGRRLGDRVTLELLAAAGAGSAAGAPAAAESGSG